jgi:hypothetical protein
MTNAQMGRKFSYKDQSLLDPEETALPCGLVSKLFPQDDFEITSLSNEKIEINKTGISWSGFKGHLFQDNLPEKSWISPEDGKPIFLNKKIERYINWVRPNTMPLLFKLWGRIEKDLLPGTYTLKIKNSNIFL